MGKTKKVALSDFLLLNGAAGDLGRQLAATGNMKELNVSANSDGGRTYEGALNAVPAQYIIGQVYEVLVTDVRENKLNARAFLSSAEIDKMGDSLLETGQMVPARGYFEDSHIYLIDGQKRWKAATTVGIKTLRVEICDKPESSKDAYLASREINELRSSQTALDDSVRFKYLLDEHIFENQEALASAVHMKQENVSKIISINKIPNRLIQRMRDYPQLTSTRIAYAISKIFPKEEEKRTQEQEAIADKVIDKIIEEEMSAVKVEELVERFLTTPTPRRPRAEVERFKYEGQPVSVKLDNSKGSLEVKIANLSAEKLTVLHEKIQSVLRGES